MQNKFYKIAAVTLVSVLAQLFSLGVHGQNPAVINSVLEGLVTDAQTGQPLRGANIIIEGITNQTATDKAGAFVLKTAQKFPFNIVVSFVGYEKQVVLVDGSPIAVQLQPVASSLDDVVVVGYGSQKRSDLTGSVASVPAHALSQQVSSFERVLQGSVSGVQVTQVSGQPGAAVSIRVRGGNSITAGNEPLYVIDGFPIYNNNNDASAGVASGPNINALSALNPSDIETIDVLKDASATAIYGSRGANGVVIITTKRGKSGRNTISYEGSYAVQEVTRQVDVLTDARQWALLKNEARVNAGKAPYYTEEQLDALPKGTDWQQAAFRKAPAHNHQLTISGGDEKTRYAISGNYYKQEGVLLNTDFERYSGRLNFDRQLSAVFKVGANFTASRTSANIADNNLVRYLLLMPPTVAVRDETGAYTYQSEFETPLGNPVATLAEETNQSNTSRVLGTVYGELELLPGLTAKVSLGADIINNKENRYIPTTIYQGANTNQTGTAAVGAKVASSWLNENT